MSKRMVWLPVDAPVELDMVGDNMGIARPSQLIPQGNRIGVAMTKLSMEGESTYVMSGVLPHDIRLCRQVEAQPLPDGVREAIGICANYGMPLGITYAEYNAARDAVTAWLAELEANSESA